MIPDDLPDDLIDRLPEEGARIVALSLLEQAHEASRRLDDAEDGEALHDFRVALRRLRSTLTAYRVELVGSVSGKRRRQIKALAERTGSARDAEVQLAWLEKQGKRLEERHHPALRSLVEKLREQERAGYAGVRDALRARFDKLLPKLTKAFSTYEARLGDDRGPTFAVAAAALIRSHATALAEALGEIGDPADVEPAHQARIKAKRLRYLLEPLRGNAQADAGPVVKLLQKLQDVLGDLHDNHVLAGTVAGALAEASSQGALRAHLAIYDSTSGEGQVRAALRSSHRPGFLAIDRLVKARQDDLFAQLQRDWLGGGAQALLAKVEEVAAALAQHAGEDVEIERKYLLSRFPERAAQAPSIEIEQGWIPGTKLRERLRRTVSEQGGERYFRTVKLGSGIRRTEVEEETSRELFEHLWRLTSARRIQKRRFKVAEGDLVWEIDQFLDRDLVLAEVELPGEIEVAIPEWLAPCVVREVTDDPAYVNWSLAGSTPQAKRRPSVRAKRPERTKRRS
jgi:CHAD domain-containing protein/CYTH domain-containing protein